MILIDIVGNVGFQIGADKSHGAFNKPYENNIDLSQGEVTNTVHYIRSKLDPI